MTFLSILAALFIERVLIQQRPPRRHSWFDAYCSRLSAATFTQWLLSRPWGPLLALTLLVLLVGWLQLWLADLGSLFTLIFGTLVLLYTLGPGDLGDEGEGFVDARDRGNASRADELARRLCPGAPPSGEPMRSLAVARAVVVVANGRLIAPVFWFVLFGAVGAAAYRAVQLLAERLHGEDCPAEMKRYSDEMRHVADWAPARLTAFGYAVAGNFDAVAHAWRSFHFEADDGPLNEAEQLLAQTGLAALDTFPDDIEGLLDDGGIDLAPSDIPPVVEDAMALVWRNLALWVTAIGAGSLIAALA